MKRHQRWMHGVLVGLMMVAFASSGMAATDRITLGSELFFTNAQGEKVKLSPGTYQVRQGTDDAQDVLLLESFLGVFQIQGELMEHEGELVASMAMSMPQTDDEHVVMLLLPNGTGVEAWGSQNPVQTRGQNSDVFGERGFEKPYKLFGLQREKKFQDQSASEILIVRVKS